MRAPFAMVPSLCPRTRAVGQNRTWVAEPNASSADGASYEDGAMGENGHGSGGAAHLRPAGEDLWLADGPIVPFFGMPYPTRMAVLRVAGGELAVWSPVPLNDGLASQLTLLGPVRLLLSPNRLHHLFLGEWAAAYPGARMLAPPGLARKRRDLPFDEELDGTDLPDGLDCVLFRGSFALTEAAFFHRPSGTALFGDLIQNFDPAALNCWQRVLVRTWGLRGSAPLEWRLSFVNRNKTRAALERVLAWEPHHIVIAHGLPPDGPAQEVIRRAFRWLT